ncbi:MAG TPA: hypothetical protein VJM47_00600 [Nitrosospira sp.]|nr:hypothetical protein [Nitrosospira sp.]
MIGRNETAHFIHNLPLLMCGAFEWLRSRTGGSDYARGEARQEQSVRTGVVESVREVRLEGTPSGIGTVAGGVAGGIGGAQHRLPTAGLAPWRPLPEQWPEVCSTRWRRKV